MNNDDDGQTIKVTLHNYRWIRIAADLLIIIFSQVGRVSDRFCLEELLLAVLFTAGVVFVIMYADGERKGI